MEKRKVISSETRPRGPSRLIRVGGTWHVKPQYICWDIPGMETIYAVVVYWRDRQAAANKLVTDGVQGFLSYTPLSVFKH